MKKGIKIFAASSILAASIFAQNSVKATTDLRYTLNVYPKYEVLTDEGTLTIPDSYVYNHDGSDQKKTLSLLNLQSTLETLSQTDGYKSVMTYNTTTKELTSKSGYSVDATGHYDSILLNSDGSIRTDYTTETNQERLIRATEYYLLLSNKKKNITEYEQKLTTDITDNEKTLYESLIADYQDDVARMEELDVSDIATKTTVYNALIASNVTVSTSVAYDKTTYKHTYDEIDMAYHYYIVLVRDLRLSELNYTVNGQTTAVSGFDKDTKTYNVYLPVTTAKNATITTSSTSYQTVTDEEKGYDYDNGISIKEGTVTLNNGTGTATVTVSFDGSDYGITDKYTKEYTVNFSVLEYQKGDVNQDGYVNSTDAALVLDCYKNNNATENDFKYGDMNEDNILNSTDAAMILDIYKNS